MKPNTYSHHNPEISSPLIERLLNALGEEWEDISYHNDTMASVGFQTTEGEWIQIFVPNALECDEMSEETSIFYVNLFDEYFPEYNTIQEVIEAFKNGFSELYDRLDEEHNACAQSYDRIEALERIGAALKTKQIKQKLKINFACDLIEFVQSHLIELYATDGIKMMKTMSNDEFAAEYGNILNTSELLLIESLGKFWESEVESIFT